MTLSPMDKLPLHSVPVTTVPVPLTVKARSMGRQAMSSLERSPARWATPANTSTKLVQALSGHRRRSHHGSTGEGGLGQCLGNLFLHEGEPLVLHEIGLGERHHHLIDAQQPNDVEMLSCLWHHALVGGHDHEDQIHPSGACQHITDEPLVSRDVHDAEV